MTVKSRAGQGRAGTGQGRAGQGKAGQGRAGQGRAGQGRAGQDRAGQGRAGGTQQGSSRRVFHQSDGVLASDHWCCDTGYHFGCRGEESVKRKQTAEERAAETMAS